MEHTEYLKKVNELAQKHIELAEQATQDLVKSIPTRGAIDAISSNATRLVYHNYMIDFFHGAREYDYEGIMTMLFVRVTSKRETSSDPITDAIIQIEDSANKELLTIFRRMGNLTK